MTTPNDANRPASKFAVGDTVKLVGPAEGEDRSIYPGFPPEMECNIGKEAVITTMTYMSQLKTWLYFLTGVGFTWAEQWLAPVKSANTPREGSALYDWQKEQEEIAIMRKKRDDMLAAVFTD